MQTFQALVGSSNPSIVLEKQTTYRQEATMTAGKISPKQDQMNRLVNKFPSQIHAFELLPEWVTIVEDVEPIKDFNSKKLEFVDLSNRRERRFLGKAWKNAKKLKGNFGLTDAKYVLAHQDVIPRELRRKYIVFPGTVFKLNNGHCGAMCLVFVSTSGSWQLQSTWFIRAVYNLF